MEPADARTMMENPEKNRNTLDPENTTATKIWRDYQFWNVLAVSFAFMILFSAFHTCGMLQASVLSDVHDEYFNGTGKEGYYSSASIYTVMAISNWIAPSMIAYTGPKYGMVIGGVPYCLFMAVFLRPFLGTLYAASILLGLGAALIWTAQGVFLTINSTEATMSRNAGMFWAILQLSNLWGNIFATVQLGHEATISPGTRFILFIALLCVAILGTFMILLVKYPGSRDRGKSSINISAADDPKVMKNLKWAWLDEIVSSFKLLTTKKMMLLAVTFAYTGFMLTFYSGVFGTSIHFTKHFGNEKNYLLGLTGVVVGLGEIIAGGIFGFLGSRLKNIGRSVVVLVGILMQQISYLLIFLILPARSPLEETNGGTYIPTNTRLALLCAFLLGFGDASINIQIYSLLGNMYAADSAPAFALFKFTQSFTAAIGFFYSSVLTLPAQLGIVAGSGIFGAFTFCFVEWMNHTAIRPRKQDAKQINLSEITTEKSIKSH